MIIKAIARRVLPLYLRKVINNIGYIRKISLLKIRHSELSAITSPDDDLGCINGKILTPKLTKWINKAFENKIVVKYKKQNSFLYNVFPGEHYRLLAGMVKEEESKLIVEIGTYTGMSSRVILDNTEESTKLYTFDIIEWNKFDSHLSESDFKNNRFEQIISDLSSRQEFDKYFSILDKADIIFCDGPKDSKFEYEFIRLLSRVELTKKNRYLIFDDIKFLNMIKLWRSIESPKIDATSFGHWSGTGIVDISSNLKVNYEILD